jgi:hypothetical protein
MDKDARDHQEQEQELREEESVGTKVFQGIVPPMKLKRRRAEQWKTKRS